MVCTNCGGKLSVVDSASGALEVIRRRRCINCGFCMFTCERAVPPDEGRSALTGYKLYRDYPKSSADNTS